MQKQMTDRTAYLVTEAATLLAQAIYEGDHITRQEPSPAADSPWSRPDLPAEVLVALQAAKVALLNLVYTYRLTDEDEDDSADDGIDDEKDWRCEVCGQEVDGDGWNGECGSCADRTASTQLRGTP